MPNSKPKDTGQEEVYIELELTHPVEAQLLCQRGLLICVALVNDEARRLVIAIVRPAQLELIEPQGVEVAQERADDERG